MDASQRYDVIVIGAGIAGTTAAIQAAQAGVRVALCSQGATFSGSSFYGGTWGLGLVGPADDADIDDFVATICEVGCGVADPRLARLLVEGIDPAIRWLEQMGVGLRRPIDASQQAYIPCFDHTTRGWHGLVRDNLRTAWTRELARLGIELLPHTELVDLVEQDGRICGVVLFDHTHDELASVPCGSVVLATGGLAGLYERRLTADDTCGSAQGIALAHGCSLVNAEFLQMMPGLVAPIRGVVVNEKAFRFSTLPFDASLLDERSGYGPFTSRLTSHQIDLAIAAAGPEGMSLSYRLPDEPPELIADYFAWLDSSFGIRPEDEMRISLYAHASNGGIRIDENAACTGGPQGLFACGECTGGMHGADRIGGLASASALVFGRKAGRSAAQASTCGIAESTLATPALARSPQADQALSELRHVMGTHAMVSRTAPGLNAALAAMDAIERRLIDSSSSEGPLRQRVLTTRAHHQLASARAMVKAMFQREQSCGSHHRADT